MPAGGFHSNALRSQALTLLGLGWTYQQTFEYTGIPKETLRDIKKRAQDRGWDPAVDARIRDEYIADAKRKGRPPIPEQTKQQLIENVRKDRNSREKSTEVLAFKVSISPSSAWSILRAFGFRSVKPTIKPGLSDKNRKARLDFCLEHADKDLEAWKPVIWSDETWVTTGQRRGRIRVWRQPGEKFSIDCIRNKFKKSSSGDFMFWGCFLYDKKGPYHIWQDETPAEKKAAEAEIEQWNKEREPAMKEQWEAVNGMRRLRLRMIPGRKPQWRFTAKTGKLVRVAKKGGIDWYRYQKVSKSI
jgi:transposase